MYSQLGLGVMIRMLTDNKESIKILNQSIGKKITDLKLDKQADALRFVFDDGTKMQLKDNGQSCCESRYMTTDDRLDYYIGSKLLNLELRNAPDRQDDYSVHEVQFLIITTDKGQFTMETHNEHNGYYGGFSIEASEW